MGSRSKCLSVCRGLAKTFLYCINTEKWWKIKLFKERNTRRSPIGQHAAKICLGKGNKLPIMRGSTKASLCTISDSAYRKMLYPLFLNSYKNITVVPGWQRSRCIYCPAFSPRYCKTSWLETNTEAKVQLIYMLATWTLLPMEFWRHYLVVGPNKLHCFFPL